MAKDKSSKKDRKDKKRKRDKEDDEEHNREKAERLVGVCPKALLKDALCFCFLVLLLLSPTLGATALLVRSHFAL